MNKSTKIALIAGVVTLAFGIILFSAQPKQTTEVNGEQTTSSVSSSVLKVDRDFHDFGNISMKDGKVVTTFRMTNSGSEPVSVNKLYTSCMCTEATLKVAGEVKGPFGMPGHSPLPSFDQVLAPGQTADIEVVFDPNAHGPSGLGLMERQVIVESGESKIANLNIKAMVTP